MEYIFIIACWVIWPILCYNLAASKGRDTGNAIGAGLLFGVFAVLYYATVPALKPPVDKPGGVKQ